MSCEKWRRILGGRTDSAKNVMIKSSWKYYELVKEIDSTATMWNAGIYLNGIEALLGEAKRFNDNLRNFLVLSFHLSYPMTTIHSRIILLTTSVVFLSFLFVEWGEIHIQSFIFVFCRIWCLFLVWFCRMFCNSKAENSVPRGNYDEVGK